MEADTPTMSMTFKLVLHLVIVSFSLLLLFFQWLYNRRVIALEHEMPLKLPKPIHALITLSRNAAVFAFLASIVLLIATFLR